MRSEEGGGRREEGGGRREGWGVRAHHSPRACLSRDGCVASLQCKAVGCGGLGQQRCSGAGVLAGLGCWVCRRWMGGAGESKGAPASALGGACGRCGGWLGRGISYWYMLRVKLHHSEPSANGIPDPDRYRRRFYCPCRNRHPSQGRNSQQTAWRTSRTQLA